MSSELKNRSNITINNVLLLLLQNITKYKNIHHGCEKGGVVENVVYVLSTLCSQYRLKICLGIQIILLLYILSLHRNIIISLLIICVYSIIPIGLDNGF